MTKSQKFLFVDSAADLVLRTVTYAVGVVGCGLVIAAALAASCGLI